MATHPRLETPFGAEPLFEVPLTRAPLVQVLTQIRFPTQTVLALGDDVAKEVALKLSVEFPVFNVENQVEFTFSPDGGSRSSQGSAKVWRLGSKDESWQLAFTADFLTLSTSRYTNRDDFCARLGRTWDVFNSAVGEPLVQRVGFRYINRVDEREFLENIGRMVRPEVLGAALVGGATTPIARSLTENSYIRGDEGLLARWGVLPPGQTFDPFTLPPHSVVSWVFDLDASRGFPEGQPESGEVLSTVRQLSLDAYRFFRWSVTDEFLHYFGGDLDVNSL